MVQPQNPAESEQAKRGYEHAVETLRKNTSTCGFSAAPERDANYFSVWARDHSITALAAVLTGDTRLVNTATEGILDLLRHQHENGQLPSYIEVESGEQTYGGYGGITSIDSNMWVVIAAAMLHMFTDNNVFLSPEMSDRYKKVFHLLDGLDPNADGFIEMPVAGDWADVMSRSYHVLYDEALHYEAMVALSYLFTQCGEHNEELRAKVDHMLERINEKKDQLEQQVNDTFWLTPENIPDVRDRYMIETEVECYTYPYYISHVMPFKMYWQHRFDALGNALAIISGLADQEKIDRIVGHITGTPEITDPFPLKVLYPVVERDDPDWEAIYESKERPYEYHNGAIWPMVSGFWIHALSKNGHLETAREQFRSFCNALEEDEWRFAEYYIGCNGKPAGHLHQAWSAAGYIIAYYALKFDHQNCLLFSQQNSCRIIPDPHHAEETDA